MILLLAADPCGVLIRRALTAVARCLGAVEFITMLNPIKLRRALHLRVVGFGS
jgi:hypothetical protein